MEKMDLKSGIYYLKEAVEDVKPGRYCSACLSKEALYMPLTTVLDTLTCPNCNAHYEEKRFDF